MEDYLKMQTTGDLFSHYHIDTRSLREKFIDEAFEKINNARIGTKYKPLTKRAIAIRINICCKSDTDIHYFQKKCQQANSYSQCFFGLTNPQ